MPFLFFLKLLCHLWTLRVHNTCSSLGSMGSFLLRVVSGILWAMSFFSRSVTHFHDFWSQIGVVILVTSEQEMERKSEWFCRVKFNRSIFKIDWENGVFCSQAALSLRFLRFFQYFGSIFFNGFSNPFIVHSTPSFLFERNFHFSLVDYLFTCGSLTLIFRFFF